MSKAMTHIVERLRAQTEGGNLLLLREAAIEIERLQAENSQMQAALDKQWTALLLVRETAIAVTSSKP